MQTKADYIINIFLNSVRKTQHQATCAAISALLNQDDPKLYNLNLYANPNIQKISHEQNSRRLIDGTIMTPEQYASKVLELLAFNANLELVIDRTNYARGKSKINFLVLAVIFKNTAIPLYWQMLDNNGGSSNSEQRTDLINWFIETFPKITIAQIYADREFPSYEFLTHLLDREINFIFRSKDVLASDGSNQVKIKTLYPNLSNMPNKTKVDTYVRRIYNIRVYLHIRLNDKNERIYLVSNKSNINAFMLYTRRWTIENMFGHLKSKGFNLESSRITKTNRLSNLFLLMSIAYAITVKLGNFINSFKPIKTKLIKEQNRTRQTKEFSLFNLGYNFLKNIYTNYLNNTVVLKQLHRLLNSEPDACIHKPSALYDIITNF